MQFRLHALRPARIVREELRRSTRITVPEPSGGGTLVLRRLDAFEMIGDVEADQWVDVLANNGEIFHEVPVIINGFEYLRQTLKFVREV